VPAIIDKGIFDMAQVQKEKNLKNSGNIKYEYLLKGLIKCSCGRTWQPTAYSGRVDKETGKRKKYLCYRCPGQAPKKYGPEVKKCETPSIRADQLEEYIWNLIVETLSNPDNYRVNLEESSYEVIDELKEQINIRKIKFHKKRKRKKN
jgi:site-specific DNA recombinase